jgi:hypothetical protein
VVDSRLLNTRYQYTIEINWHRIASLAGREDEVPVLLLLELLAYLSGVKGSPFMIISRRVGVSRNALRLRFPLVV